MAQYKCPKCKDEGPFEVRGQGCCSLNLSVDSDGCVDDVDDYDVDEVYDYEFDDDSSAYCRECGYHNDWCYFDVDNQDDDEDESERDEIEFEEEKSGDDAAADELMEYIERRLESEKRA